MSTKAGPFIALEFLDGATAEEPHCGATDGNRVHSVAGHRDCGRARCGPRRGMMMAWPEPAATIIALAAFSGQVAARSKVCDLEDYRDGAI